MLFWIILLLIMAYGLWGKDNGLVSPPESRAYTGAELERMASQMIGKSKRECNQILNQWSGRW